jgi:hypothetical protein
VAAGVFSAVPGRIRSALNLRHANAHTNLGLALYEKHEV